MKLEKLEKEGYYHIYNRGINGTKIFVNDENKRYFLSLTKKYLSAQVSLLAFCLMDNHFHFLILVDSEGKETIQAFSNLFNAYVKAFNKQQHRTGSLFEKHFKRKSLSDENYLRNSIIYIHRNPEHHGKLNDFAQYPFSSYRQCVDETTEYSLEIECKEVVSLFDSVENFKYCHREDVTLLDVDNNQEKEEEEAMQEKKVRDRDLQGFENLAGESREFKEQLEEDLQGAPQKSGEHLAGRGAPQKSGEQLASLSGRFYTFIQNLQDIITSKLEEIDGKAEFKEDLWERPEGGGGRTRVIENGAVFEKGGVNISAVHGPLAPAMQKYFKVGELDFFACGLSLVLHPKNPMVPTVHANWRYFEMYDKAGKIIDSWFGGGQDLTPYYLFEEDALHFHRVCKSVCDRHDPQFYVDFKQKCDDYFWNAHRGEARGIGGLFFDYCKASEEKSIENWYDFVTDSGSHFLESYLPIVEKRKDASYSEGNRTWQEIRRGRYVEFNLVHDKGTHFGLKTNGRIESILMSLPPKVQWVYDHHPEKGSEEQKLVEALERPRAWIND